MCIHNIDKLIDWGLTALAAQIGYIYRAFDKYVAVTNLKLMRKLTMLREYI